MLKMTTANSQKPVHPVQAPAIRFGGDAWDDNRFKSLMPDLFVDEPDIFSSSDAPIAGLLGKNGRSSKPSRPSRSPREPREPRERRGFNFKLPQIGWKKAVGGLIVAVLGVGAFNQYGGGGAIERNIDSNWSEEVKAAHQPVQTLLAEQTQANIKPELIKQMLTADIEALKATTERQYQLQLLLDKPEDQRTETENATITTYQNAKITPISQEERDSTLAELEERKGSLDSKTGEIAATLAEDIQRRYSYAIEQAHLSPIDSTALVWAIVIDPATRAKFGGLEAMVGAKTDDTIFLPLLDKYSIAMVEHGGNQDLALATVYAGRTLVQQSKGVPELTVVKDFIKRFTEARALLTTVINEEAKSRLTDDEPAMSDMAFRLVAMMGTPQVRQSAFFLENENWANELMETLAGFYAEPGTAPTLDPSLLDPVALIPAATLNTDDPYNFTALLEDLKGLSASAPDNATVADFLVATEFNNQFPNTEELATSEDPAAVRNYYKAQSYKTRVGAKVTEAVEALTLPENPLEQVVESGK